MVGSAPTTAGHAHATSTVPASTVPANGTTAPPIDSITSFEPVERLLDLPAACEPVWSERQAGEITFARGNELFSYSPSTGAVSCLALLDRSPTRLLWSPDGTTLLVDADVLLDASGARPSGFDPGTVGITWSRPNGEALIAPSPDGTRLVHIDRDDASAVTDVAALAETWAAAYHPSGEAILAAGVAPDGRRGLFIADNDGGQLEQALTLDDAADTITELSVSADGRSVNFIHDHAGSSDGVAAHVHRLDLASIFVIDVATYGDVVPTGMVTSVGADNALAFELVRSTVHHVTVLADGADLRHFRVSEQQIVPVGFADARHRRRRAPPGRHTGRRSGLARRHRRHRCTAGARRRCRGGGHACRSASDVGRSAARDPAPSRRLMTSTRTGRCDQESISRTTPRRVAWRRPSRARVRRPGRRPS